MSVSLIGNFGIHLNHNVAIDDHAYDPEGACLTYGVDRIRFKAISNKKNHEEGPS
jgi:hypothetical protein